MPVRPALGFRVHSGWSAVVAVDELSVIYRGRIEIRDASIEGSKQPYHHAAELGLERAGPYLERCGASSRDLAARALDEIVNRIGTVSCCGMITGSGRKLPELAGILAAHALIHTAEGEFFRDVVRHACEQRGLRVTTVPEKELAARTPDELHRAIVDIGKQIGPPWTQDEKYSTLAAWMAIAATPWETESRGPGRR